MMKVMSNREFSRKRKYYKNLFINNALTEDVCNSEEYKNFECEENKRIKAKEFVKNWLETRKFSSYFINLKNKVDLYLSKYSILSKKRGKLITEFIDLELRDKIDKEDRAMFFEYEIPVFKDAKDMNDYIKQAFNCFPKSANPTEEYKKEYQEAFYTLRKDTCALSVVVNKIEKVLEYVRMKEEKLKEAKRKEHARQKAINIAIERENAFSQRNKPKYTYRLVR